MEIAAGEFKAKCLRLMDQVEKTREAVVVTKRGKPVAKLVPVEERPTKKLFGCMAGSVSIAGDIVSPQTEEWFVESGRDASLYHAGKQK